jgi:hypothetical protein
MERGRVVRVSLPGQVLEYRPHGSGHGFDLFTTNDRGEELFRYRLSPHPVDDENFVRFWLGSFDSVGMNGLHLNRVIGGGRLSAHDLNLRIDDGRDKANVKLRDGYVAKVSEHFGIDRRVVRAAYEQWEQRRCRNE